MMMKNEGRVSTKEDYVQRLIDSIDRRKKESLENIRKTDIYSPADILDGICFFEKLKEKCFAQKPDYYVKNVLLFSDDAGRVEKVEYEYFTNDDNITDAGFAFFNIIIKSARK